MHIYQLMQNSLLQTRTHHGFRCSAEVCSEALIVIDQGRILVVSYPNSLRKAHSYERELHLERQHNNALEGTGLKGSELLDVT